jgi:hypothetical protein
MLPGNSFEAQKLAREWKQNDTSDDDAIRKAKFGRG